MEHRVLKVLDIEGLQAVADFSKDYLHFDRAPAKVASHFERFENRHAHDRSHLAAGVTTDPL